MQGCEAQLLMDHPPTLPEEQQRILFGDPNNPCNDIIEALETCLSGFVVQCRHQPFQNHFWSVFENFPELLFHTLEKKSKKMAFPVIQDMNPPEKRRLKPLVLRVKFAC